MRLYDSNRQEIDAAVPFASQVGIKLSKVRQMDLVRRWISLPVPLTILAARIAVQHLVLQRLPRVLRIYEALGFMPLQHRIPFEGSFVVEYLQLDPQKGSQMYINAGFAESDGAMSSVNVVLTETRRRRRRYQLLPTGRNMGD